MKINGTVEVFTIGQVAAVCRVAPTTARRWVESGTLCGYIVPSTANNPHHRVTRKALVKFLAEYGMPQEWIKTCDRHR